MATRTSRYFLSCWILGSLLAPSITFSSAVFAQQPVCSQNPTDPAPAKTTRKNEIDPPAAGLQAFIDPQTGELVSEPPPGSPPATEAPATEDRPALVEEVLPDGTVIMQLDGRFQHPLQAEVQGEELITCHGEQDQHD